MITKEFLNILNQLGIGQDPPNSYQWQQMMQQLNELLVVLLAERQGSKQMFDLANQEMHKMIELIERKAHLTKSIFDASPDVILTLDSLGQVIEFNKATISILKLDDDSILGQQILSVLCGGTLADDLILFFSNTDTSFNESYLGKLHEKNIKTRIGHFIEASVCINRIQMSESIVYSVYIRDLTAVKASEKVLQESRAKLMTVSKMSALGEMAGGVAHEINTPLAVILIKAETMLDFLDEEPLDKQMFKSSLESINSTVGRVSKIIQGLMAFSRDGQKDSMVLQSVSKIIEDTFSMCRERFYHHSVELHYSCEDDCQIECRPGEISQVVLNMLNNAYDAIQNLPKKWVKVSVTKDSESVFIAISDSGSGIPLDIQDKMMQPFFTTKEVGKGTGLGLSISRGIIESHKGQISIDNLNPNTCIVITLPLHSIDSAAAI